MIKPEIKDRMALGPETEGTAQRLVAVSGTQHAGADTARRWVQANVPGCAAVLDADYAGRDDHGQQVYMVTYQEAPVTAAPNMDLLRSYAGGPRIWDAAALVPEVMALADAGLIEPVPDSAAYQLTGAGRAELEAGS